MKQSEKNVLRNGIFPIHLPRLHSKNLDLLRNSSLLFIMLKISSKILSDLARFAAILEQKLPL